MFCNAGSDSVGEKVSPNMLFLLWSSVKDTKLQLSCIHVFSVGWVFFFMLVAFKFE